MKVSIELSPEYRIPYAVIYADKITDEIQKIMESFSRQETPITVLQNEENLVVLQPEEIYMVRVEAGDTILFGKGKCPRRYGGGVQDGAVFARRGGCGTHRRGHCGYARTFRGLSCA